MESIIFLIEHVLAKWVFIFALVVGATIPFVWAIIENLINVPTVQKIILRVVISAFAAASMIFGAWALGFHSSKEEYLEQAKAIARELVLLQQRQTQINANISTDLSNIMPKIDKKNKTVVEYIDREVVKYDTTCHIGAEVNAAHNAAALK
ncbi:hypothetical protein UFOVP116_377 [uncultured Caudovirales phage]|uniref:Uncharacterized protein n=1 Tax=uncultured Caudovirales phage TaxID=2100421 RepID=A0A6J5L8H8_9CAUD|nr:hypothetical protein UFOVP116_377 [uncultured Caudovirales phage]